jgi:hypothetical protein
MEKTDNKLKGEEIGGIRKGVNVTARSLKAEVNRAVNAFGRSSRSYNGGRWDGTEAQLWFNVIRDVIEDWMKEPTTVHGERYKESAEEFLFGKTPKAKTWRKVVCECAGIHPDSLIRFVTALKAEIQRRRTP